MYGRVVSVQWPAPRLARVVLGGEGLDGYEPTPCTDGYVSVAIPPPGAPYEAPFEVGELRGLPRELRPFRRRYSVRRWDPAARELTFEFVVHGDGPGGAWAADARPGDALVFTGPAGAYRPDAGADWHLMAGDESALPAIAASLEAVPAGAPVFVRLVCDGPEHEIELASPGELDLAWLHRNGAGGEQELARAVRALALPAGRGHAFVHGEAEETRAVRRHLLADRGMDRDGLSCSPYWRRGMTDEQWREIKAAWVAEQERDAS